MVYIKANLLKEAQNFTPLSCWILVFLMAFSYFQRFSEWEPQTALLDSHLKLYKPDFEGYFYEFVAKFSYTLYLNLSF